MYVPKPFLQLTRCDAFYFRNAVKLYTFAHISNHWIFSLASGPCPLILQRRRRVGRALLLYPLKHIRPACSRRGSLSCTLDISMNSKVKFVTSSEPTACGAQSSYNRYAPFAWKIVVIIKDYSSSKTGQDEFVMAWGGSGMPCMQIS